MDGAVIRVGVAGWDYPDWRGVVYPAKGPRGFDRLAFIARFVDVVEINSTFYRPAEPRIAASWVSRTRDRAGFRFTAKVHRSLTHDPPGDIREGALRTLQGLAPLRQAGMLSALLVQFPQSFRHGRSSLDRLARVLAHLEGWPVVVEVRHASWDRDDAAEWLEQRGAGWCVVDQPRIGGATVEARPRRTSSVGYLRLHGRNRRDWFRADAGRDARYDYLYGSEELRRLAHAVRTMAHEAAEIVVVQNNHFRGQALVNALEMKHLIDGSAPGAPADLARAYPEVGRFARVERDRLF